MLSVLEVGGLKCGEPGEGGLGSGKEDGEGEGRGQPFALAPSSPEKGCGFRSHFCCSPHQQRGWVIVCEVGFCGNPETPRPAHRAVSVGKPLPDTEEQRLTNEFWDTSAGSSEMVLLPRSTALPFWQFFSGSLKEEELLEECA